MRSFFPQKNQQVSLKDRKVISSRRLLQLMHFDFEKMPIDWQDNILRGEGAVLNVKKTCLKFSNFMHVAFFMPTNSPVSNQECKLCYAILYSNPYLVYCLSDGSSTKFLIGGRWIWPSISEALANIISVSWNFNYVNYKI